jgi:hypothetical protein
MGAAQGGGARTIREELVSFHREGVGKVVAVLPVIPESAPFTVREGIARRRIAATTGTCPCGAGVDYQAAARDGLNVAEVLHERSCPADTDRLVKAIRRWTR